MGTSRPRQEAAADGLPDQGQVQQPEGESPELAKATVQVGVMDDPALGQAAGGGQGWPGGEPVGHFPTGEVPEPSDESDHHDGSVGVDDGMAAATRPRGESRAAEQGKTDNAGGKGQQTQHRDEPHGVDAEGTDLALSTGRRDYNDIVACGNLLHAGHLQGGVDVSYQGECPASLPISNCAAILREPETGRSLAILP